MKASAYLKKFGNKIDGIKNKKKFLEVLESDFKALIVTHHAHVSLKQFERSVGDLRSKWEGIGNKRGQELSPKLWDKFESSIINPTRVDMHSEELAARQQNAE